MTDPEPVPRLTESEVDSIIGNASRLEALNATNLLNSPPEECFDRITKLAARLLSVPVAFMALADVERDFYKSHFGFASPLAEERNLTGRTFCHYTIASGAPLVLDDTTANAVYRDVPTVRSLGVRAYLGVPVKAVGNHVIGSLCAIDFEPRHWTEGDVETMSELALSVAREIDLRIVTSEALRNANVARESIRAKEEVLAIVAHDLRSPLNILAIGAAHLAQTQGIDAKPILDLMDRANAQMAALINDLLEVEKLRRGRFDLNLQTVRADVLLADALKLAAPIASQKGVTLVNAAPDCSTQVHVDYSRILRVFANLIGNAIKFSVEHSAVRLTAADSDGQVRFSVEDAGSGIAEGDLDKIFSHYWQGTRADVRGVGLGLSIVRAIVEGHRGTVSVSSQPGVGSVFSFTVPTSRP